MGDLIVPSRASRATQPPELQTQLLSLIGDRAAVLNSALGESGSGGDVDCMVENQDPRWPLRAAPDWRLCQALRYDVGAWYWVLDRDGSVMAIDALDDPLGLGMDSFPTAAAFRAAPDKDLPPWLVGAYLTSKRIRKGMTEAHEWERIYRLADTDPRQFQEWLCLIFGKAVGTALGETISNKDVPDPGLWKRARRAKLRKRLSTPRRIFLLALRNARRVLTRVTHPTGLVVQIVGPDGSGKSTVAEALPEASKGLFRRYHRVHWRPGLLPRLGTLAGRKEHDPADPHGKAPRGRLLSGAILAYYWLDFLLGFWVKIQPLRIRSGLIIWERGWPDMSVDPARYRIALPSNLIRAFGRILPKPDLIVWLDAPPELLAERKAELPEDELQRQTSMWPRSLPRGTASYRLDASSPLEMVIRETRERIVDALEERSMMRLADGWINLPSRANRRWVLPRGPRRAAASAPLIYQPVTLRGLAGWTATRGIARVGGLHLLRRGKGPESAIRDLLGPNIPPRGTVADMRVRGKGRYVAVIVDARGRPHLFAKIATQAEHQSSLKREEQALRDFANLLPHPLTAPEVVDSGPGFLLLEAISWKPRALAWKLDEEIAALLGVFFARVRAPNGNGVAHGDVAPWNLLSEGPRWVLVDWEHARSNEMPLFDVFHYLVQSHALLGRPRRNTILKGVNGEGWVGRVLHAYCEGAGLEKLDLPACLVAYVRRSIIDIDAATSDGRSGIASRRKLLAALQGIPAT